MVNSPHVVTRATNTFKSSPATATAGPSTNPVSTLISGTTNMAPLVVVKPSQGAAKSWVSGVTVPGAPLSFKPMVQPVLYCKSGKVGIKAGLMSQSHGDDAMADWFSSYTNPQDAMPALAKLRKQFSEVGEDEPLYVSMQQIAHAFDQRQEVVVQLLEEELELSVV